MAQLGKYMVDSHNILHFLCTSDWATDSGGNVESPTGYFWRISNTPEDVRMENTEITSLIEDQMSAYDIEDGPEFRESLVGHYLLVEDSNGFVNVSEYLTEMALRRDFEKLQAEFEAWDSQDEPEESSLVESIKKEVRELIADGTIPATVSSFSELHDYVDANMLGGTEDLLQFDENGDSHCDIDELNAAQTEVSEWLKNGRQD